jgi:hypothetical protein
VEAVQMPVWVERDGLRTPLSAGDTLEGAHELRTGAGAALAFRLPEGSLVRLGENTRLDVRGLSVRDEQGQVAVEGDFKLFDGFFRFVTAAAARVAGRRQLRVQLRTATVGIRGTDFWTMTDAVHDAACLFEGRVDLDTQAQGPLVLERPTAFWARFFDKPVQPVGQATPEQLAQFLASTEVQSGRGVAVEGGRWQVVAALGADSRAALQLAAMWRGEGYPALLVGSGRDHRVVLRQLATLADAQAVLARLPVPEGVQARALMGG